MKILVISDLHISTENQLGVFGWNADDFISEIDRAIKQFCIDKVILNGDTFDLYRNKLREIVASNRRLIDYFKAIGAVYVKGNHDEALGRGCECYSVRNSVNKSIHIEHGHKADFINGTRIGRLLSRYFFKLLKLLLGRPVIQTLYNSFLDFDEGFRGKGKYDCFKYHRYAMKLLRKHDVVILGHTHKIEVHNTYFRRGNKYYINSGSCSFGRFQAVVLDTESLHFETLCFDTHKKTASAAVRCFVQPGRYGKIGAGIMDPAYQLVVYKTA